MLYRLFTPGKADIAAETHLHSIILLNWVNRYLRKQATWITTSLPAELPQGGIFFKIPLSGHEDKIQVKKTDYD